MCPVQQPVVQQLLAVVPAWLLLRLAARLHRYGAAADAAFWPVQ